MAKSFTGNKSIGDYFGESFFEPVMYALCGIAARCIKNVECQISKVVLQTGNDQLAGFLEKSHLKFKRLYVKWKILRVEWKSCT